MRSWEGGKTEGCPSWLVFWEGCWCWGCKKLSCFWSGWVLILVATKSKCLWDVLYVVFVEWICWGLWMPRNQRLERQTFLNSELRNKLENTITVHSKNLSLVGRIWAWRWELAASNQPAVFSVRKVIWAVNGNWTKAAFCRFSPDDGVCQGRFVSLAAQHCCCGQVTSALGSLSLKTHLQCSAAVIF